MQFTIDKRKVQWEPKKLIILGYTSRDLESLQKHIDELQELGVPPPKNVPMLYELSPILLQTDPVLKEVGNDGSGEAEIVLLDINGVWHVGLGSDHTDRVLEAVSVQKSKQICAKPVSEELWLLDSIQDHWDDIELKSWVTQDSEERIYQEGRLSAFMKPENLLRTIEDRGYCGSQMALFCGTLPLINGEFIRGQKFRAELHDAKHNRSLHLSYEIKSLKDAEEDEYVKA